MAQPRINITTIPIEDKFDALVGDNEEFVTIDETSTEVVPDHYYSGGDDPLKDNELALRISEVVGHTPDTVYWYNTSPQVNAVFVCVRNVHDAALSWLLDVNAPKFVVDSDYSIVGKIVSKAERAAFIPDPSVSFLDVRGLFKIKDPLKMLLGVSDED
jgi:hypothetical protein